MVFYRSATFTPVGKVDDYFVREVGMYMWRRIPFDRYTWSKVDEADKEALHAHLRVKKEYV